MYGHKASRPFCWSRFATCSSKIHICFIRITGFRNKATAPAGVYLLIYFAALLCALGMATFKVESTRSRWMNPERNDWVHHGKVIVIFIARLAPPLKRRGCAGHPFKGLLVVSPSGSFHHTPGLFKGTDKAITPALMWLLFFFCRSIVRLRAWLPSRSIRLAADTKACSSYRP